MGLRAHTSLGAAAAAAAILLSASAGHAQMATTLEQAELAGLSPHMRTEVQNRMKQGGQTVYEILQTELLNTIKAKHLGSQIVALDFNRGIAVVKTASGNIRTVNFNTSTLELK